MEKVYDNLKSSTYVLLWLFNYSIVSTIGKGENKHHEWYQIVIILSFCLFQTIYTLSFLIVKLLKLYKRRAARTRVEPIKKEEVKEKLNTNFDSIR